MTGKRAWPCTPFINSPCRSSLCTHPQTRHISKYYTEDFRTGRNWAHSDTGHSWIAPATNRDGSAASRELVASGKSSSNINGDMNGSNEKNPSNRGSGQGAHRGDRDFLHPVSRQVARNLVKPLHPPTLALPSPFYQAFLPPDGAGGNAQRQKWTQSTGSRGGEDGTSTLTSSEAAVANECLVSLLAVYGTTSRLATGAQVTAALKREGFPDAKASLALLKDVYALKSRGVSDRLWRRRRGAALIRLRAERSLFARLPSELFRNVLTFLA